MEGLSKAAIISSSAALVAGALYILAYNAFNLEHDNFVEEVIEAAIEHQTGLNIDFSDD